MIARLGQRLPPHLKLMTEQNRGFVLGSVPANSQPVPAMAGATRACVGLRAGELAKCPEVGSLKPASALCRPPFRERGARIHLPISMRAKRKSGAQSLARFRIIGSMPPASRSCYALWL